MKHCEHFAEVSSIADDVCSGCATQEQLNRLENLLKGDIDAQRFYYDYLNVHARLSAGSKRNTAVVYRKITEELVVQHVDNRSANHTGEGLMHEQHGSLKKNSHIKIIFIVGLAIAAITASIFLSIKHRTPPLFIAHVIDGNVALTGPGYIEGNALLPGVYRIEKTATIKLLDGDTLHFYPNSLVKLFNNREIRLRSGKVILEASTPQNTLIHTQGGMLHSNGGDLTLDLQHSMPKITSGKSTLWIPARWRPNHYWSFDSHSDRAIDNAGSADGVMAVGTTRVKGLVGEGAIMFDNSINARIELGNGGAIARGTGSFSASDGVTIEALIRPDTLNHEGEIYHVFRKDSLGGRIQLSVKHHAKSEAVISFGVFILGEGYNELDLPFDGRHGRPNFVDLMNHDYHHVVATYSARTGEKIIYLNGKKQMSYRYPLGSKMVSGGPGQAVLGNTPRARAWHKEAFAGIIDEVAFYDFALSDYMVGLHLKHIQQGHNYYGLPTKESASNMALPTRLRLSLMPYTTYELIPITGLPNKIIDP